MANVLLSASLPSFLLRFCAPREIFTAENRERDIRAIINARLAGWAFVFLPEPSYLARAGGRSEFTSERAAAVSRAFRLFWETF